QKAYEDLPYRNAQDYIPQRFHKWAYDLEKPTRTQMYELLRFVHKWLQPETNSPTKIVEMLVMDRFLRNLPAGLRQWVSLGDPTDPEEMMCLVERYGRPRYRKPALSRLAGIRGAWAAV
uniref:SCAN box domain-containing protein n=1 Tax=Leptobrachium leishanense TaxID=445787 RepID=A0A8C5PE79_9ANUR